MKRTESAAADEGVGDDNEFDAPESRELDPLPPLPADAALTDADNDDDDAPQYAQIPTGKGLDAPDEPQYAQFPTGKGVESPRSAYVRRPPPLPRCAKIISPHRSRSLCLFFRRRPGRYAPAR